MMNTALALGEEMGVTVLDMHGIDGLIDYATDSYDWVGHMNPSGASKTTAYIGAWLKENYDLADYRGQAGFARWDENLAKYEAHRAEVWE